MSLAQLQQPAGAAAAGGHSQAVERVAQAAVLLFLLQAVLCQQVREQPHPFRVLMVALLQLTAHHIKQQAAAVQVR